MRSEHEVVAVVTSPDRPMGRGRELSPMPVAQRASELGLRVIQPSSLADGEFIESMSRIQADLFVVVAFKILPEALLQLPKHGSINLHPSMLPAYRGAAPLQRAIMNGEVRTAVSTIFISPAVDSGPCARQRPAPICLLRQLTRSVRAKPLRNRRTVGRLLKHRKSAVRTKR